MEIGVFALVFAAKRFHPHNKAAILFSSPTTSLSSPYWVQKYTSLSAATIMDLVVEAYTM